MEKKNPSLFSLEFQTIVRLTTQVLETEPGYTANVSKHRVTSPTSPYLPFSSVHLILGCPSMYFSQPLISFY